VLYVSDQTLFRFVDEEKGRGKYGCKVAKHPGRSEQKEMIIALGED
jgi:hypothetical protein